MTGILAAMAGSAGGTFPVKITAGTVSGPNTGYSNGAAGGGTYGTLITFASPTGKVLSVLADINSLSGPMFRVTGFSVDPGQASLTNVTINGVTKTGASATYSFSSGAAQWTWTGNIGFVNGNTYTGSVYARW